MERIRQITFWVTITVMILASAFIDMGKYNALIAFAAFLLAVIMLALEEKQN